MGTASDITATTILKAELDLRAKGFPPHGDGYYVMFADTTDAWTIKRLKGRYPLRRETMVSMAPKAWESAERFYPGCVPLTIVGSSLVVGNGPKDSE